MQGKNNKRSKSVEKINRNVDCIMKFTVLLYA